MDEAGRFYVTPCPHLGSTFLCLARREGSAKPADTCLLCPTEFHYNSRVLVCVNFQRC